MRDLSKKLIFNKLDSIESKLGIMAHEITDINKELKQWQAGELKDSYFSEFLNKYIDQLNN